MPKATDIADSKANITTQVLRTSAGQTADALQVLDSDNDVLMRVNALGEIESPTITAVEQLVESNTAAVVSEAVVRLAGDAAIGQRLMAVLAEGVQDCAWMVIGDSTGNQPGEWPDLLLGEMAALFPAVTFRVSVLPSTPGDPWPEPTTIQTGTGPAVCTLWNASVVSSFTHWVQPHFDQVVTAKQPDMVFISHGKNHRSGSISQAYRNQLRDELTVLAELVTRACPLAELVMVAQSENCVPSTNMHMHLYPAILRDLAQARGWGLVNVLEAFRRSSPGGVVTSDPAPGALNSADGVHPNAAGERVWADEVWRLMRPAGMLPPRPQQPSSLAVPVQSLLVNGDWADLGNAPLPAVNDLVTQGHNPDYETNTAKWAGLSSAALSRDTDVFRSGTASAKVITSGANGTAGIGSTTDPTVVVGQSTTLGAWVLAPAGAALRLIATLASGATTQPFIATGDWQWVSCKFAPVGGDTTVDMSVRLNGAQAITFHVDDWVLGASVNAATPANWTNTNCVAERDQEHYENPAGRALRLRSASAAPAYITQAVSAALLARIKDAGGWCTMTARVRIPAPLLVGNVRIIETGGSAPGASTSAVLGEGWDGFKWLSVTRRVAADATGISARLYCDAGSTGTAVITCDRIILAPGPLPRDLSAVSQRDERILTTKGDLLVATAPGVVDRQPVGTLGQVLTADPAAPAGVKWAPPVIGTGGLLPTAPVVPSPQWTPLQTMATGHGWVRDSGTGALSDDPAGGVLAANALQLTTAGDSVANIVKKTGLSLDLTGKQLLFWIKCDKPSLAGSIRVYLSSHASNPASNCYRYDRNIVQLAQADDWLLFSLNVGDYSSIVGTPNRDAITTLGIYFRDTGQAITLRIGGIATFSEPANGVVSLTFDDDNLPQSTIVVPKLAQYGMRASFFPIVDSIASVGQQTLAQIKDLQNLYGHEVGVHCNRVADHLNWSTLPDADAIASMQLAKQFALDNGLTGIDTMAYPQGVVGSVARHEAMRALFRAGRTIVANHETWPPGDPLKLRCVSMGGTTVAANIAAEVTKAITNKSWLILLLHTVGGTGQMTQSTFAAIVDDIAAQGVAVKPIGEVLRDGP